MSIFKDEYKKLQRELRNRYLSGERVSEICKEKGFNRSTFYYHVGDLSVEDKALHIKNYYLKKLGKPTGKTKKQTRKRNSRSRKQSEVKSERSIGVDIGTGETVIVERVGNTITSIERYPESAAEGADERRDGTAQGGIDLADFIKG